MSVDRFSDAQLKEMAEQWSAQLDDELERSSYTADELIELAQSRRALATVTDSPGQRRALLSAVDSYERAAHGRRPVRG